MNGLLTIPIQEAIASREEKFLGDCERQRQSSSELLQDYNLLK